MSTKEKAVHFLTTISLHEKVCILYHGDADGICSAAMLYITLREKGIKSIAALPLARGENPFSHSTLKDILSREPNRLILVDLGSRTGSFPNEIKTLIIDHHVPQGDPDVDVFYNTYSEGNNKSASEAVYELAIILSTDKNLVWRAIAGVIGDIGMKRVPRHLRKATKDESLSAVQDCVSLINAARRHAHFEVKEVFELVVASDTPRRFLASATAAGFDDFRHEVYLDLKKNLKVPPIFKGRFALFLFSSPHQIHPLIATIWAGKLKQYIIIAANEGFLPEKICFSIRSRLDVNLLDIIKELRTANEEMDYGHEKATGGVVSPAEFDSLLEKLELKREKKNI
jgi:single-stranded-DNA-specific exonuclease